MQNLNEKIPGCDADDMDEWLQCDKLDQRYQLLIDNEIIESTDG